MLIPIPIGEHVHVPVQGKVWKIVSCEHCQQKYAYLIQLQATGKDINRLFIDAEGSTRRAQAHAEQNLLEMSRNMVLPVPCPNCGFYQEHMVRRLKEDGTGNGLVIAGLAVIVLLLVALTFDIPKVWMFTVVGVLAGVGMMAYADVAASLLDPNAGDPETRKARGRKHAIWGEQLVELLAKDSNVGNKLLTDRPPEHDARENSKGMDPDKT